MKQAAARSDEVNVLATDVQRLIKRIESDSIGSRVLDHAIHKWLWGYNQAALDEHFTTNFEQALALLVEAHPGRDATVNIYGVLQPKVTVTLAAVGAHIAGCGSTPALAMCATAIRFREFIRSTLR